MDDFINVCIRLVQSVNSQDLLEVSSLYMRISDCGWGSPGIASVCDSLERFASSLSGSKGYAKPNVDPQSA